MIGCKFPKSSDAYQTWPWLRFCAASRQNATQCGRSLLYDGHDCNFEDNSALFPYKYLRVSKLHRCVRRGPSITATPRHNPRPTWPFFSAKPDDVEGRASRQGVDVALVACQRLLGGMLLPGASRLYPQQLTCFVFCSWEEHRSALVCGPIIPRLILADTFQTSTHGPGKSAWKSSRKT